MAFLSFTTRQKYEVAKAQKHLHPHQHELVLIELRQVQKLKHLTSSFRMRRTDQPQFKQRVDHLKKRAFAIEQQIMSELRALHHIHRTEIEILRQQFSSRNVGYQRELEAYFAQQKRYIEEVVYRYASILVELDASCNQEVERLLKKMLDDLGMEAEKVVWGKESSRWRKIRSKVGKFFSCC